MMQNPIPKSIQTQIVHSAGSYVVKKAAEWAVKQLQPKNHHLSFDDVKKLHELFGPLLKVDPEAINCIAHLVNSNHSDSQTDITLPIYKERELALHQLPVKIASEVNRSLATVDRYLKNLGLAHLKFNKKGNIHYAIALGILTWFHCRFEKVLAECIENPVRMNVIFNALIQSIDKIIAMKSANEKADVLVDLKTTLNNELIPAMKRLVVHRSAAKHFKIMQKGMDEMGLALFKYVTALSNDQYTQKEPNLVFCNYTAVAGGYFTESAGQRTFESVGMGSHLVPRVDLSGPFKAPLQKGAKLALKGKAVALKKKEVELNQKGRQAVSELLHPACLYKVKKQLGSKSMTLVKKNKIDSESQVKALEELLLAASKMIALATILGHLSRYADFAGGQTLFNPAYLPTVLQTLNNLIDKQLKIVAMNPLYRQVNEVLKSSKFAKEYAKILDYGDANETPNLLLLVRKIEQCTEQVSNAQKSINFKRANFANQQAQSEKDEQEIITGLMRLAGPDAPKSLRLTLKNEFKVVRKPSPQQIVVGDDDDNNRKKRNPEPQFVALGSSKQQAIDANAMFAVLQPLCKLFETKGVDQKKYLQWLNETFKGTALKFYTEKISDGMFSSHYVLKYKLSDLSSEAMAKIAETVSHARLAIARGDYVQSKKNISSQILAAPSPLMSASKGEIKALKAVHKWMNDGKDLETETFERLMRTWIGYAFLEPATSKRFEQMASKFMPTYCLLPFVNMFEALNDAVRQAVMTAKSFDETAKAMNKILASKVDNLLGNYHELGGHHVTKDDWWSVRDDYVEKILKPLLKDSFQIDREWGRYIVRAVDDKRQQSILLEELQAVFVNPATMAEKMRTGFILHNKVFRKGHRCGKDYIKHGNWRESEHVWKRTDGWQPGGLKYAAAQARIGVGLQEYEWGKGCMLSISDDKELNQTFTNAVIRIQQISANNKMAPSLLNKELVFFLSLQNNKLLDHERFDPIIRAICKNIGVIVTKNNQTTDINISLEAVDGDDNNGKKKKPLDKQSVVNAQKNIQIFLSSTPANGMSMTGNSTHDVRLKRALTKVENTARSIGDRDQMDYLYSKLKVKLKIAEDNARAYKKLYQESDRKRVDSLNERIQSDIEYSKQLEIVKKKEINGDKQLSKLKLDILQITNENISLKKEVQILKETESDLSAKYNEVFDLLEIAIKETLPALEKIVANSKEVILAMSKVKSGMDKSKNVDNNESLLNDDQDNELIALGRALGANENQEKVIRKFMEIVEKSINENKTIAINLKKNLESALKKGDKIKDKISDLRKIAEGKLDRIEQRIQLQIDLAQTLNNTIETLQSQKRELLNLIKKLQNDKREQDKRHQMEIDEMNKINKINIDQIIRKNNEALSDFANRFKIESNNNSKKVNHLTHELAKSKRKEGIHIKVKEADKKEWYPGYTTSGKVGAFFVDFILIIPPIMNLLGWIFSGFGLVKEFHTIMHEKAVSDFKKELVANLDKEPEIYDMIEIAEDDKSKFTSSTQDMHKKEIISLHDDVENAMDDNIKKPKIVKTLVKQSEVIDSPTNSARIITINEKLNPELSTQQKTFVIE